MKLTVMSAIQNYYKQAFLWLDGKQYKVEGATSVAQWSSELYPNKSIEKIKFNKKGHMDALSFQ